MKLFKPTLEDQKRIAKKLANKISVNKGLKLSSGEVVQGTKLK